MYPTLVRIFTRIFSPADILPPPPGTQPQTRTHTQSHTDPKDTPKKNQPWTNRYALENRGSTHTGNYMRRCSRPPTHTRMRKQIRTQKQPPAHTIKELTGIRPPIHTQTQKYRHITKRRGETPAHLRVLAHVHKQYISL